MENGFHTLPPSKRFLCLPAKKRAAAATDDTVVVSSVFLPAKKRVWAPVPLLLDGETDAGSSTLGSTPAKKRFRALSPLPAIPEESEANRADLAEDDDNDGILCAVCRSTDGDPSDPIVFCDGCDLMVHASCYGSPLSESIPEGDWFCQLCRCRRADKGGGDPAVAEPGACCLCPLKGGALKETTDGRWAHIVCALLVPEVFFRDPEGRDGIECSLVPSGRFGRECYLCRSDWGCTLECSQPKCERAFHLSCGFDGDLCIEYHEGSAGGSRGRGRMPMTMIAGFCLEHSQLWEKQKLSGKFKLVPMSANQAQKGWKN